jgi:uncharacterized membrane protein
MRRYKLLLAALFVSVAVNLLIAGIVVGRMGGAPKHPGEPPGAWAAAPLSPESRRLVRERMAQERATVRPLRLDLRAAQGAVRRAVMAEPFVTDDLKAALAQLREVEARYRRFLHDGLAEVAAELPPAERAALLRAALARDRLANRRPGPAGPPR